VKHSFRQIEFKSINWIQSIALRYEILRKPLSLMFNSEELFKESQERVFGVFIGELLVSTANCVLLDNCVKARQVATLGEYQNLGIGTYLISNIEKEIQNMGVARIEMNARKESLNFYLKIGYSTIGTEFIEVGIPHYKIYKNFSS